MHGALGYRVPGPHLQVLPLQHDAVAQLFTQPLGLLQGCDDRNIVHTRGQHLVQVAVFGEAPGVGGTPAGTLPGRGGVGDESYLSCGIVVR